MTPTTSVFTRPLPSWSSTSTAAVCNLILPSSLNSIALRTANFPDPIFNSPFFRNTRKLIFAVFAISFPNQYVAGEVPYPHYQ